MKIDKEIATFFINELRQARAVSLKDSENFEEILFTIEKLGFLLTKDESKDKRNPGLGKYKDELEKLVQ